MAKDQVLTGAIALIKSGGQIIGKMKDISYRENTRRSRVGGIGTIFASELPVVEFSATLSCSFMTVDLLKSGVPNAMRRDIPAVQSQILNGNPSLEDQLVLDQEGVQIDIFKKVSDVVLPDGTIKPKLKPIGIVAHCVIESSDLTISEGQLSGMNQSFQVPAPIIIPR